MLFPIVLAALLTVAYGADCRKGFVRGENTTKCYFIIGAQYGGNDLSDFRADFFEAHDSCHGIGSDLASVESINEYYAVKKILEASDARVDFVWINGNAISQPSDHKEIYKSNGQKLISLDNLWSSTTRSCGQHSDNAHCLGLLRADGSKLMLEFCSKENAFICEMADNTVY